MRTMLCAAALLSMALLGAGCKKGPTLVGKWNTTLRGQSATVEFKPDDTATTTFTRGPVSVTTIENYKLDGEKLTMSMKDIQLQGLPAGGETLVKRLRQTELGKVTTDTVKFVSDDQVTTTNSKGLVMTLNRIKEGS